MTESPTLEYMRAAIQDGASARGLVVWDGLPFVMMKIDARGRAAHPLHWRGGWELFLDVAAKAGVRVVYLGSIEFNWEAELLKAMDDAGYHGDIEAQADAEAAKEESPIGSALWTITRLHAGTGRWAAYEGTVATITCLWFKDGVVHSFHQRTEWLDGFEEAVQQILDEAEAVREEDSAEEELRLRELAEEMVRHPRYVEATSEAKREHMARELFPGEDSWTRQRVASLAVLHYWWNLAPGEHSSKVQQAHDLYKAGQNLTSIAAALKISRDRVKALLAETPEE